MEYIQAPKPESSRPTHPTSETTTSPILDEAGESAFIKQEAMYINKLLHSYLSTAYCLVMIAFLLVSTFFVHHNVVNTVSFYLSLWVLIIFQIVNLVLYFFGSTLTKTWWISYLFEMLLLANLGYHSNSMVDPFFYLMILPIMYSIALLQRQRSYFVTVAAIFIVFILGVLYAKPVLSEANMLLYMVLLAVGLFSGEVAKMIVQSNNRMSEISASHVSVNADLMRSQIKLEKEIERRKAVQKQLELSYEKVIAADEIKLNFLNMVSHELRTPLNGILGLSELVLDRIDNQEAVERDEVKNIHHSGKMLLRIVESILQFVDITDRKTVSDLSMVNLRHLIENSCQNVQKYSPSWTGKLHYDFHSTHEEFLTEPVYMGLVISNIVDNAIKFSNDSDIAVSCYDIATEKGTWLAIKVEDQGIGMSANTLNKIYEPFRQIDECSTRKFGGIGMGLAIVKHVIESLKGTIEIKSELGKGTQFTIKLPIPE